MTLFVYHKKKFKKQMDRLRMGGGKASLAAYQAEKIIKRLFAMGQTGVENTSRRTKYGEFRIDKALKYDLGGGYRLICVKQEKDIIIFHVGSHDDCDRRLQHNRGFRPAFNKWTQQVVFEKKSEKEIKLSADEIETGYDSILPKKIDEKILRNVFSGLCAK